MGKIDRAINYIRAKCVGVGGQKAVVGNAKCKYDSCKSSVDDWKEINIPPPQSKDLKKAVGSFFLILLIAWLFSYYVLKLKTVASFIIAVVVGFIMLNVLFFPHRINTFSEFNSSMAIYIFIQTFTPLIIYIYALYCALKSSRCNKNWI